MDAGRAAEEVARASYARLLAFVAARTGDVAGAEDALSEAFAAALADWPIHGVPDNPPAWLLAVARRKRTDARRRSRTSERAGAHLLLLAEEMTDSLPTAEIPDERLALMFVCAHPAIDPAIRAPLMLQTVLGLDAASIASAFLVAPATMGQRLVRAKSRIKQAGIPFRIPDRSDLPERLEAVLDAVYAAFSTGWTDPAGADLRAGSLAPEAIWLCRLLASLLPDEPEILGLLALMLYTDARRAARRDPSGDYVPLEKQDISRWDANLIEQAEIVLRRAGTIGSVGRFQLEAAIQSAHVARRLTGRANWAAIVKLYDGLTLLTDSPVVAINRAVALAEAAGPSAGLAELESAAGDPRLATYQPYWAARAALLARSGFHNEAASAYRQAIGLEADPAVRRFLQQKLAALGHGT
jgi:RNA polymerase sigma-70 factor (ECF subfamily)